MVDCIIQARMGSSRLPGKVLMKISDRFNVLDFLLNQLNYCKTINRIIIATSKNSKDDVIQEYCIKNSISCFRGNEHDVLDRYYNCAKKFESKQIIRITADCPLIDPNIVDNVVKNFLKDKYDYYSNILKRTFPIGTDVEIFSFEILEKIWSLAKLSSDREHVTMFIRSKKIHCKTGYLRNNTDLSNLRITLDRIEDLELIRKIVSKYQKYPILLEDVVKILNENKQLLEINMNINNNEGYELSLKNDKNVD